jgi:hypothetical protein
MEAIILIAVGSVCFFGGICFGSVLTSWLENTAPDIEQDDHYHPIE